jgi:hypothetical protein
MSFIMIGLVIGSIGLIARPLLGQPNASPQLTATQSSGTIPPGTVITQANWQQYKQFFSEGEIYLWQGTGFWKMPPDVRIEIGPTTVYPLPAPFVEATQKYSSQTRIEKQSDGRWKLLNYVAGVPFPVPEEPNKGQKILVNVSYSIRPHLIAMFPDSGSLLSLCNMDRFNNVDCEHLDIDLRQLAYNWEPGVPRVEKDSGGAWYAAWARAEDPEQYRGTVSLSLQWQDNLRIEETYLYIPAMRKTIRQIDPSHCAPGNDMGWNSGIADFDADYVNKIKLLALTQMNSQDGNFPQNYDMPLGWAKSSWGRWELRDVWVIDIRPIPTLASSYCYGKRVMYADASTYVPLVQDLYNRQMNLQRICLLSETPVVPPGFGTETNAGGYLYQLWNLENDHAVFSFTADQQGRGWTIDSAVKPQYDDIQRYQTAGGVMSLAR